MVNHASAFLHAEWQMETLYPPEVFSVIPSRLYSANCAGFMSVSRRTHPYACIASFLPLVILLNATWHLLYAGEQEPAADPVRY
jgi:hypothetical protein